jgi:hypothetical protein
MLGIKKINAISRGKKKLKIIIYLISFFTILPIFFFNVPKLLNFSHESIKENLKDNNNINVNDIIRIILSIINPVISLSDLLKIYKNIICIEPHTYDKCFNCKNIKSNKY